MTPEVRGILEKLDSGQPLETGQLQLVHCRIHDKPVIFCVDFERDPIQRHHRAGKYYEALELDRLRDLVPPGATVIDVGANTGNHSLFFAMELDARHVVPIEPNPPVYRLLIANAAVNGLRDVIDLSFLGVGLSDRRQGGFAMEQRARNIGGARMLPGAGDLETYPGDELFQGMSPDLIKIDVEGMEMAVLSGLKETIRKHRPLLFIEVDTANEEAFLQWADTEGYEVTFTHKRYKVNRNYILRHAD